MEKLVAVIVDSVRTGGKIICFLRKGVTLDDGLKGLTLRGKPNSKNYVNRKVVEVPQTTVDKYKLLCEFHGNSIGCIDYYNLTFSIHKR